MADLKDLQKILDRASKEIPEKALRVIGVEGLGFIQENFEKQGFQDVGLKKWAERKTTDRRGRDITRYRTNRRGRKGELNAYGRKNEGRSILTGHNTGGDKLRNSFRKKTYKSRKAVGFSTYKHYALRHNNGLDGMPERKFIGKSRTLNKRIQKKLEKVIKQTFKG